MASNLIDKADLQEPYIVTKDLGIKNITDFNSYYRQMNEDAEYLEKLDTDDNFTKLLEFGNALANEIRLKILHFIHKVGTTCFCELESIFKLKKSTLNYHMKLLLKTGLVHTSKKGKVIVIKLGTQFEQLMPETLKTSFQI